MCLQHFPLLQWHAAAGPRALALFSAAFSMLGGTVCWGGVNSVQSSALSPQWSGCWVDQCMVFSKQEHCEQCSVCLVHSGQGAGWFSAWCSVSRNSASSVQCGENHQGGMFCGQSNMLSAQCSVCSVPPPPPSDQHIVCRSAKAMCKYIGLTRQTECCVWCVVCSAQACMEPSSGCSLQFSSV